MKKILVFILCLLLFISVFICYDKIVYEKAMFDAGLTENSEVEEIGCGIEVRIVELYEDTVLVQPIQDYPYYFDAVGCYEYMFYASDILGIDLNTTEVNCELFVDKVVHIVYVHSKGTTGTNPIYLNKVEEITDIGVAVGMESDWTQIISYKGRRFEKSRLSEETLKWLELSEEEKLKSDYIPKDLKNGRFEMEYEVLDWGVEMNVKNVSSTGLSLVFTQEDFIPTTENDNWEYSMTSYFKIEKLEYKKWYPVKTKYKSTEIPWSSEIQIIDMNNNKGYYVDWEWLYGDLESGTYRIVKEVKVLRGLHDYDFREINQIFVIDKIVPHK